MKQENAEKPVAPAQSLTRERTRRAIFASGSVTAAALAAAQVGPHASPVEAAVTPVRYSCFYQVSFDAIDYYRDPTYGLPNDAGHEHIFSHSHASVQADQALADYVHAGGSSFKYAPCFDLNDHAGWAQATDGELAAMARNFRDEAISKGADYFGFNEMYSNIPTDSNARNKVMTLLYYLNEPDSLGRRLYGITFFTEAAATPGNWTSAASSFWSRVKETSRLVVMEHYHGHSYVCTNSESFLANHLFAMRTWLNNSGEADKQYISNNQYTVLHSSRYGPGSSGWAGADSNTTSLAAFQRNLSKCAKVTRVTLGGNNRICFGPIASVYTQPGVHPRIRLLIRWHYNQGGTSTELNCVDHYQGNCQC